MRKVLFIAGKPAPVSFSLIPGCGSVCGAPVNSDFDNIFMHLQPRFLGLPVRAIHGTGEPFTGFGAPGRVVVEQHLGEG